MLLRQHRFELFNEKSQKWLLFNWLSINVALSRWLHHIMGRSHYLLHHKALVDLACLRAVPPLSEDC
eukprot:2174428-Amphidinium_carterae.1